MQSSQSAPYHSKSTSIHIKMSSNVGDSGVYEANEQRTYKDSEIQEAKKEARYNEGKENAHNQLDSKDERSIANKLAAEEKKGDDADDSLQTQRLKQDATLPARAHGNEPSKGAKIDQELREEEEAELARKGKK